MADEIYIPTSGEWLIFPGVGIMAICTSSVPADGAVGYPHGAIAQNAFGTVSTDAVYVNTGTNTSATFRALDVGGGTETADVISEATAGAGVTVDGVLVKDTGIFNADLTLSSTNEINIQIGTVSLLAMDDAAISGNAADINAAGISSFVETQDGGTSTSSAAGSSGGNFTFTAGLGSAAGGTSGLAGGASGAISFVTQAGGAGQGAGAAGNDGVIRLNGPVWGKGSVTNLTDNTSHTITAAEILTHGLITITHTTGSTATYTLPTGTLLDDAVHSQVGAGEFFDWSIINLSAAAADTVTVAAGANNTFPTGAAVLIPSGHISTGGLDGSSSARFRSVRTAGNTFVTYRIA